MSATDRANHFCDSRPLLPLLNYDESFSEIANFIKDLIYVSPGQVELGVLLAF